MELSKRILRWLKRLLMITWYTVFYYHSTLRPDWVLIDSKNGIDLASNMFRIAEELRCGGDYESMRVHIAYARGKRKQILELVRSAKIPGLRLVRCGGFRYCRVITLSKFLFTDTTLPNWFVKREGQTLTNTWHGTPWKKMGKDVLNRAYDMGNVQRNHLMADYLIYPSDYMKDRMANAYCLPDLYHGKVLFAGYPRNSVFYDDLRRKRLKDEWNPQGKRFYAYMPTWRGLLREIDSQRILKEMKHYFSKLDGLLGDDEVFYVRLHPFIQNSIDYRVYSHIRPFPNACESYDFLNLCDCLVTDYSSVLFDFANSRKKIILFVYDKEEYMAMRGIYIPMDSFPFPQVRDLENLVMQMRTQKNYDDAAFCREFCQYDGPSAARKLLKHVLKEEKLFHEQTLCVTQKANVFLYAGPLLPGKATDALLTYLSNADRETKNYYVAFRTSDLKKDPMRISILPQWVGILPISSMDSRNMAEWLCLNRFFSLPFGEAIKKRYYHRLYEGNFGACHFDAAISFTNREKDINGMLDQFPCNRKACLPIADLATQPVKP